VRRRAAAGTAAGAAGLGAAILGGTSWSVAVLVAWEAAAAVFLLSVWSSVAGMNAVETERLAHDEDGSHAAGEAVVVGAGVASLVAVAFTLAEAGRAHGAHRGALIGVAVGSVLLAWAAVHTVYMLRYARLYYTAPIGGIAFAGDDRPDYLDFAYLAVTIGMTFQVSDTDISRRQVRRTALHHALLSYLFGTVIVAITVSTVAGLLGG
jgi:uncharacterized membrane protein